jgi:hypothetical protein
MYAMPFGRPFGFGGFGLVGLLVLLIQMFVIFGIVRALFGHGRHGWRHMYGPWGNPEETGKGDWKDGVPPMFEEWHRRSHADQPTAAPDK